MRAGEVVPALAWTAIGGAICWGAAGLGLGSARQPGPGLFPFVLGAGIVLLATWHAVANLVAAPAEAPPDRHANLGQVAMVVGLLCFFAIAIEPAGFVACAFVFFSAMFRVLSRRGWPFAVIASALATGSIYLLFDVWLRVNLPRGSWGL
ncbi:MAG: tripartite tricarboxylate transporter TctB family protein [Alphaproteobacteria bacterium]|nr:tripartite tricarboxylate transporter TctB family protein [Alphaproteobacteria bacterium]